MAFRAVSCGYCRPLGTSAGTMFISESQMCFSTCSDRVLASGQPCAALRQVSGPCCVTSFPPQSEWPHRGTVWSRARRHSVSKRTSSTKKKYTEKEKVKKTLTGILHLMSKESSDTDGEEENWIDYIKRSTREVEHKLMKCNISNLVVTLGELQLRHAQTIADHGKKGWTLIFLV